MDSVPTHNHYDFPSAVAVLEIEEGYNTIDDSWTNVTNNIGLNSQLRSSGVDIQDNIYDVDTQTYLELQGASNVSFDFTNYWYRKFQADTSYADALEFFNLNSVDVLTAVNHYGVVTNISRIARGGNFGNVMFNYTIAKDGSSWTVVNDSTGYDLEIFNITSPYDDVMNLSDGSVLAYNVQNYSTSLAYPNGISIGDYGSGIFCYTYSGSGDWFINENCTITTIQNVNGAEVWANGSTVNNASLITNYSKLGAFNGGKIII